MNELHDLPLAHRLIDAVLADYITTACALGSAACGTAEGRAAIDSLQHLHLDGWHYKATPRIVDELTRAGLLITPGLYERTDTQT